MRGENLCFFRADVSPQNPWTLRSPLKVVQKNVVSRRGLGCRCSAPSFWKSHMPRILSAFPGRPPVPGMCGRHPRLRHGQTRVTRCLVRRKMSFSLRKARQLLQRSRSPPSRMGCNSETCGGTTERCEHVVILFNVLTVHTYTTHTHHTHHTHTTHTTPLDELGNFELSTGGSASLLKVRHCGI